MKGEKVLKKKKITRYRKSTADFPNYIQMDPSKYSSRRDSTFECRRTMK